MRSGKPVTVRNCGTVGCQAGVSVEHAVSIFKAVKAKRAIPLQAWVGPEGSRRLRLPDFITIGT